MVTLPANAAPVPATRRPIPGPPTPPLIDWRAHVIPVLRDPVVQMLRLQHAYGDIVALGQSATAPILVFAPEYNRQLLTNPSIYYSLDSGSSESLIHIPRETAAGRLLAGIAGMNGPKHTEHRRMLIPAFHKKRVDALNTALTACAEAYIAEWRVGQPLDLAKEMFGLSLRLAITGLLGLDPDQEGHEVEHLLETWSRYALSIPVGLLPFNVPGLPYRRFQYLSELLEAEFRAVIARKRAQLAGAADGSVGPDALAILLDAEDQEGDGLTDTDLLGHLTTLFTAGHETTACALTWTLFLLSQHPQVMSDLLDELDSVLHGSAPTLEHLRNLPLLNNVINESLRPFPPGMWMLRTSVEPSTMGPYSFAAGTHFVYSPAVTHRRPDVYAQPDKFLPRRWETIDPGPYEYLPFGNGPRRCLGATYAQMELRVVLPIILQRFRVEVPDGTRVDRGGTALSMPKGGLPVVLGPPSSPPAKSRIHGNIHALLDLA